jgi:hypothetical protein
MPERNARRSPRLALALFVLLVARSWAGPTEFWIAPAGSDGQPGTREQPLASLEGGRDAVRRLKRQGPWPADGVVVWLRGGDYPLTRSFELTSVDSGRDGAPVTYRARPGETARVLGGQKLSGFRPVTDPKVLARLGPAAQAAVREVDLRALGIKDYAAFVSRGFTRSNQPAHNELFFNGKPMPLAGWPEPGQWLEIAGYPPESEMKADHLGGLGGGFYYSGDRPARWKPAPDIQLHGYWCVNWAETHEQVASIDLKRHLIRTEPPFGHTGFGKGQHFRFLNVFEELDQPGEWYLDRRARRLYFWPPADPAAGEALLSLLGTPLIRLTSVSNVVLRGLVLEAGRSRGVEILGGASNQLAGCLLRNLGTDAVFIQGGWGHTVRSCDLLDTGDGGVWLTGGDRQTLTPSGTRIENCDFARQGRWDWTYRPAVRIDGVGHIVAHNHMHEQPHAAVLFTGNEHRIEFNEIDHAALEADDVGTIYSGRDATFHGNRIRHNYLHDIGRGPADARGVYMDDLLCGQEITGNIFYKVPRAIFIGGGRDFLIENNVFVDCQPAIAYDSRGLTWTFMVSVVLRQGWEAVPGDLYLKRYPALATTVPCLATNVGVLAPGNIVVDRNICVGDWFNVHEGVQRGWITLCDNFTVGDPGFVDPAKLDFRLRPDAPAWKIGFQAIPVADIGLQADELRRELATLRPRPSS